MPIMHVYDRRHYLDKKINVSDADLKKTPNLWVLAADAGLNIFELFVICNMIDENGRKHGPRKEYDHHGDLMAEGMYKHGVRHGQFICYHRNGVISNVASYKDGKMHGTVATYATNGQMLAKQDFEDGRAHGDAVSWYFPENAIHFAGRFLHGNKHGVHTCFCKDGTPFRTDVYLNGVEIKYDKNATLVKKSFVRTR